MKRILALVLVFLLVFPCALPAVAEGKPSLSLSPEEGVEWLGEESSALPQAPATDQEPMAEEPSPSLPEQAPATDGAATAEGLKYTITDGKVTITDYTGSATELVIPDTIEGYPVTSIGNFAFEKCTGLRSIDLPNSVTIIGDFAFYGCTGLTGITLPDGLTSIGAYAFSDCTGLTSMDLPEGLTSIGKWVFSGCTGLTSIALPDRVTSIGYEAFSYCTGLTSIDLPEGVTSIGDYAFSHCTGLTSIDLPEGVTSIGDYAFYNCTGLTDVYYSGTREQWEAVEIGRNNEYLLNANIHFEGEDVTSSVPEGLSYTITDGKVTITGYTGSATELVIPDTIEGYPVTSIGYYAFRECTGLTSITLPESLTSIGAYAFEKCTGLTSIDLPEGLTSVGFFAFWYCTSLTSIDLPESLTSIGDRAFLTCTGLTDVYYSGTREQWEAVEIGRNNEYLLNANIHFLGEAPAYLLGDANGDGAVNFSDIQRIYAHRILGEALTGDALIMADANKDGNVNFADIQRIYQHLSTSNKLF